MHIDGSVVRLTCSVEVETVAGDHLAVLLRVHTAHSNVDADPLVFHHSGFTGVAARERTGAPATDRRTGGRNSRRQPRPL